MRIGHHHHHRTRLLATTDRARRPGGYILVEFAFLLVPLLLMVGLSVDVGYWYNRISDIQKAADAAALAGVVWLPDVEKAEDYALEAAARNGFADGVDGIDVSILQVGERRLRVTIRDPQVGSFFFQGLGGRPIDLSRKGTAEYVLAVPLGSPRNFFGTGTLLEDHVVSGMPPEYLYHSAELYCSNKLDGDRYQTGYFDPTDTNFSKAPCSGNANTEFRSDGYSMYIEAVPDRTAPIEVWLYDAPHNAAAPSWQELDGETCTTTTTYDPTTYTPAAPAWPTPQSSSGTAIILAGPAQYQTRANGSTNTWNTQQTLAWGQSISIAANRIRYRVAATWTPSTTGWTGPGSNNNQLTITGPAVYQTQTSTQAQNGTWPTTVSTLASGATTSFRRDRLRYRTATLPTSTSCVPKYKTVTEPGIDDVRTYSGTVGEENFRFKLIAADNTPLNDNDNTEILCDVTYTKSSTFDDVEYLGSRRWNKFCTIPTDALPGRYRLQVTNTGTATSPARNDGVNNYGIVAKYTGAAGEGLCDGRNDNMCPRVFGRDAISVRAAADTTVASFYLTEIEDIHAGKQLLLELWDPGEGGQKIEIMKPSGTDGNTWTPATFSWSVPGVGSGSNVTSVSVDNPCSRFNGKLVSINVPLADYDPPDNNQWWQIRYTFNPGSCPGFNTVFDRTTWSARITGDPVHLIEEDL